jgi:hypothetical protein
MSSLEAEITALTQEFVARLVEAIRNASFADVASLSVPRARGAGEAKPRHSPPSAPTPSRGRHRETATHRAEIGERIAGALRAAPTPMGVRALSSTLGIAPDQLAGPIKELRAAGKIRKHGDKRATTYSAV